MLAMQFSKSPAPPDGYSRQDKGRRKGAPLAFLYSVSMRKGGLLHD